jgi:hypothetical protein
MEPGIRTIILKVTRFESIIIVGFDPPIIDVNDITIRVIHVGLFMKIILWLKTHLDLNG